MRACSHAALTGVPRGRFCACPLAGGAPGRGPRALLCVPARTRRTLACSEGASVRARSHAAQTGVSHAAHPGAPRGRFVRACSHAAHDGVPRKRFCAFRCARSAHGRGPRAPPCVPARTRRPLACPEGASVRARSYAALTGAPRKQFRARPLARGASWRAPKAIPCLPAGTRRILARPEGPLVGARLHVAPMGTPRRRSRARGAFGRMNSEEVSSRGALARGNLEWRRLRAYELHGNLVPWRCVREEVFRGGALGRLSGEEVLSSGAEGGR